LLFEGITVSSQSCHTFRDHDKILDLFPAKWLNLAEFKKSADTNATDRILERKVFTMSTGVFAGSFDPPTKGHEDIIERASKLFDRVVVMVSPNSAKHGLFTTEQKLTWLQDMTEDLDNVEVALCDGLTIARARELGGTVLIRSMRNAGDYLPEANNAWLNAEMKQGMETLFLLGKPEHSLISSSNVRELLKYNQSIEFMVPACVFEALQPQFAHKADANKEETQ